MKTLHSLFVAGAGVLIQSTGAAQGISIRPGLAINPSPAVQWHLDGRDAIPGVRSASLLPGGDWLIGREVQTPESEDAIVSAIFIERWRGSGTREWSIQRRFTNTVTQILELGSEIGYNESGYFHTLLRRQGGSELWIGTTEGQLIREGQDFDKLWVSFYDQGGVFGTIRSFDRNDYQRLCLDVTSPDGVTTLRSFCLERDLGSPTKLIHTDGANSWLLEAGAAVVQVDATGRIVRLSQFKAGAGTPDSPSILSLGRSQVSTRGFILGGYAQAPVGGDLSRTFGGHDAWLIWTDFNGSRIQDRTYGGIGDESLVDFVPTGNSEMLLAIQTKGSGITGNKAIDGDGVWLVQISGTGAILGQTLLPELDAIKLEMRGGEIWLLAWDSITRQRVSTFRLNPQHIVSVRAFSPSPFDVLVSDTLASWRTIAQGIEGEIILNQPTTQPSRYFRVIPNVPKP